MIEASSVPVCPGCRQPTDLGSNTCEHCGYIHLGRLVPGAVPPPQAESEPKVDEADSSSAPPGWYEYPHDGGQRYWDGQRWHGRAGQADPRNDGLATIGWVTAILVPIIGLAVGVMLSGRNDRRGMPIAITAVVVFVAWIAFWVILNAVIASSVSY
jgi:hypothetical protein